MGPLEEGEAAFRELSDDQAICIGYANNLPQTNHLQVEQWLVRRLARRLYALRLEQPELQLGPDGKVIVLVREAEAEAEAEAAWSLESLSCSLQQKNKADDVALHRAVRLAVEAELRAAAGDLPGLSATVPE